MLGVLELKADSMHKRVDAYSGPGPELSLQRVVSPVRSDSWFLLPHMAKYKRPRQSAFKLLCSKTPRIAFVSQLRILRAMSPRV